MIIQAEQAEAMSKVFEMFGEGKTGKVSRDKLGDVLRLLRAKLSIFEFPKISISKI